MVKDRITFKEAMELFKYDETSGRITWNIRPGNRVPTGIEAGTVWRDAHGYRRRRILFRGKQYVAARVIWLLKTGKYPHGQIDHIDGNTLNNRFENLRDVGPEINSKNKAMGRNNSSGVNGVSRYRNKWLATIRVDGTLIYLGVFKDIEAAAAARQKANMKYGFSERHGKAM